MELLTIREHLSSLPVSLVRSVLLIFLVFCVVLLCVFTFWVPGCDIRYNFRIKTMFGSSLPPFVCRSAHVLFTLFVFVCVLWRLTHIVLCFCFVFLGFVYPTLDCPFLIAPSVFSNVYLCSRLVSGMTFTRYAHNQKNWESNNLRVFVCETQRA